MTATATTSIWFSDRVVTERYAPEPMIAMSMVAAYSEKMKFGTAVIQLPLRNPVVLAKEMATLDHLSGGRFLPGHRPRPRGPTRVRGPVASPRKTAAVAADEAMAVMRRLWSEDFVTHHGEFFTLNEVSITPKPVQQPLMPLWVGGRSKAAARRVGRLADGWLVSAATPQEIREGTDIVFATAAELGREVDDDHIGALLGLLHRPHC